MAANEKNLPGAGRPLAIGAAVLALAAAATGLVLASQAQAQSLDTNSAAFNAGYGRVAGSENHVVEYSTRDVVFAQPEETVDALLARMTDRRIRHLPVCKGKRLAGIISIGDLVKYKISEAQAEADGLKAYIAAG